MIFLYNFVQKKLAFGIWGLKFRDLKFWHFIYAHLKILTLYTLKICEIKVLRVSIILDAYKFRILGYFVTQNVGNFQQQLWNLLEIVPVRCASVFI